MPPKKTATKKQKKGVDAPPEPPDIPPAEQAGLLVQPSLKKSNKALEVPPHTQQAEPINRKQATKKSKALVNPPTAPHGNDQNPVIPPEPMPFTKVPTKRGPKKTKDQPPKPDDVTQARTQLLQAISGVASSASNSKPSAPLPPPLQTRRAAKAAAQAVVDTIQQGQQADLVAIPPRPQPRPFPPGMRLSPDSDDGFNLRKRRAKLARAKERYCAAQNPPADPVPSSVPPAPTEHREVLAPTVPLKQKPNSKAIVTSVGQVQPSTAVQTAAQQAQPTVPFVPQKPPSVTSPGGRHYSGLFPSTMPVSLTGPSVPPPSAMHFATRSQSSSTASDKSLPGVRSDDKASEDETSQQDANDDDDSGVMDERTSTLRPIQYSSNAFEDCIIRLCIRHGLDPTTNYHKMARAYLAAKKKRDAEEEEGRKAANKVQEEHVVGAGDKHEQGTGDSGGGASGGGSGDGNGGGGGDGDGDRGGGGDGNSDNEASDSEEDEEHSGDEEEDRFGPEDDPWLIDPDTDNTTAPCTYHFQTSRCGMRYYGPPPEFVGSNGEVERFTTYRWNKPGASMAFQRIAGGFKVPRTSIWQRADARREIDEQRAKHLAAGLIQPHNDDDDSGSDYGATQEDLKTRGKPVDSDLERESDVGSPVKAIDKGKGRDVPIIPLTDKGKRQAEPAIPLVLGSPEDCKRQDGAAAASGAGTGGRPSMAELATCDALGVKFHQTVTDIGHMYGRRPELILARLGLAPAPTRHTNVWNAFQTLFALQAPEVPHDADWVSKCNAAYKQALDGLTPEQKKAFEQAILAELDGIAEDPERIRTPAARMKTIIDEARRMSSIERYTPDIVRFSVFIYTGTDPAARQLNCVVTPSTILKSALERHNIALQPLVDIASDLIRGEVTLQHVENAACQQGPSGSVQQPVDVMEEVRRDLHEFNTKERLMFYRVSEEPRRALEKVDELPAKDRGPMYRRISTLHILTEMNLFAPDSRQQRKSVPFGNWATIAISWRITLLCWPNDLPIWPGCPVNIKHLTIAHWQQLCAPFIDNPAHAVRIEAWTDEQKGYSPDSLDYRRIPLVKNVGGDILVNILQGQALIKRARIRGAGTHPAMPITVSDHEDDEDNIELELVKPRLTDARTAFGNDDMVDDFNIENYTDDIDNIVSSDGEDLDSETVEHNGDILYRIRSVTPAKPVESYDEDYMYALDRLDREQQHHETRDLHSLPQRSSLKPVRSPSRVQVHQRIDPAESRLMVGAVKRRHQDEDEPQYPKRKVVRIQPPPKEEPVRERRREEVARLQQLRSIPAPEPRRPRIPPLIFPPPSQLPTANREGVSTEAFYKAIGGPPPSGRPLKPHARTHQPAQKVATQTRHPVKPRIPAHFDSDGADDLTTGPNMSMHSPPSVRFNYQRELRDGQAGPSNERFIPKGQRKDKHRDL